jgi:hypothetical protein
VRRLVDERDPALREVDHGRDHQRASQHGGDRKHRPGTGRANGDDHEPDSVGDGEGTEVTGGVGGRRIPVAEQGGDRDDDDLHGDHRKQPADDRRRRRTVGPGDPPGDTFGEIRLGGRGEQRPDGQRTGGGHAAARLASSEVGLEQTIVHAERLTVGSCRDGLAPTLTRHGGQVA